MSAPRKYDQEFRERAVRMYRERLAEGNDSKLGARRHVGSLLDLNPATLRNWVEDAERAEGTRAPAAAARSGDSEEVRALKKRVTELERANEILKTASAFFARVVPSAGGEIYEESGTTTINWRNLPSCWRADIRCNQ
ncbi:transposase [Georgenia subflava]|uniref:Transposase n=1 Tax=Georgenia subflava TaxID=1622177 RepID=A0A6N7ENZ8_9MICO|nr:transposase [Georgenia subflava]MPV36954.1 transposase [Georgenia subflava]